VNGKEGGEKREGSLLPISEKRKKKKKPRHIMWYLRKGGGERSHVLPIGEGEERGFRSLTLSRNTEKHACGEGRGERTTPLPE